MIPRLLSAVFLCALLTVTALADGGKLEAIGAFQAKARRTRSKMRLKLRGNACCLQTEACFVKSG